MFGIGNGSDEPSQAQDTKSIWGDMFGLSGLMKVITDPALMAHAHAMMQATIEGANSSRRIEAKLDRLLGALGHEITDINARFPQSFQPPPAAVLIEHGAARAGSDPAATGVAHDGSQGAAGSVGTPVGGPRTRGPHDETAGG
jgi:hypothetical protein